MNSKSCHRRVISQTYYQHMISLIHSYYSKYCLHGKTISIDGKPNSVANRKTELTTITFYYKLSYTHHHKVPAVNVNPG